MQKIQHNMHEHQEKKACETLLYPHSTQVTNETSSYTAGVKILFRFVQVNLVVQWEWNWLNVFRQAELLQFIQIKSYIFYPRISWKAHHKITLLSHWWCHHSSVTRSRCIMVGQGPSPADTRMKSNAGGEGG